MRVFGAVEMWCRRQAAAAILPLLLAGWLTGESSEALTTFGKTNTQPPNQPPAPTLPPARGCNRQADCAGITGTSCVRTPYDTATKCLCGDNQPPVNGRCDAQYKGLRHVCSESNDCAEGLACGIPNTTASDPGSSRPAWANPNEKQLLCLCDTENGYVEKDHSCSDAEILRSSLFAFLALAILNCIFV